MDLVYVVIVFVSGIAGGLYASSVGGGALLSIPILILIGQPPHFAVATTRFAAIPLELTSAYRFYRNKKFNVRFAIKMGVLSSIGAALGATTLVKVEESLVNILIGLMLVGAAFLLLNKDKFAIKKYKSSTKNNALLVLGALILGLYGGFFGAAFGVFMAILLVMFGFEYIESASITRVIGFCMSFTATIVFARAGLVDYGLGISLGVGFALGSWIGIGFALKKSENYIKNLLLSVIFLSLIKIIFDIFN